MPNWCDNTLQITHNNPDKLKPLKALIKTWNCPVSNNKLMGLFTTLRPMPKVLRDIYCGNIAIDGIRHNIWREEKDNNGDTIPIPVSDEEQKLLLTRHGATNWYAWANKYWGSKWDADICGFNVEDDTYWFSFLSAWSPPIELYEYLHAQGFLFEATYCEGGIGFIGQFDSKQGDTCYDMYDDEVPDFLKTEHASHYYDPEDDNQ